MMAQDKMLVAMLLLHSCVSVTSFSVHSSASKFWLRSRMKKSTSCICAVSDRGDRQKPNQIGRGRDQSVIKAAKSSVDKQYRYVQGGFNEVQPPKLVDNSTTSMYAAFDSALRASSYNMFCSPLLPVEAPTPFRRKDKLQRIETLSASDSQNNAGQVANQILKQYQELDRYLSPSQDVRNPNNQVKRYDPYEARSEMQALLEAAQSLNPNTEEEYEQLQSLLGFERMGTKSRVNSATFTGNMTKHRAVRNASSSLLNDFFDN